MGVGPAGMASVLMCGLVWCGVVWCGVFVSGLGDGLVCGVMSGLDVYGNGADFQQKIK